MQARAALQGRLLMWDVEGREGWVDGKIQGYCRHFEGFRGKVTNLEFCRSADGELTHGLALPDTVALIARVHIEVSPNSHIG